MRLLVISSAPIVKLDGTLYLYAPYEKEMQLWSKHADNIQFCCPVWREDKKLLIAPIAFEVEKVVELPAFDITSFSSKLKAIPLAFVALLKIFKAMKQADHIHLRCPGNMGLLGALVQVLFPNTPKTAKYAGNWDPRSKQPWSYRLQKWIVSHPFLTRNMQVLVYGEWPNQTQNIKPFFTATYSADEIQKSEFTMQNELSLPTKSRRTEKRLDSVPLLKKAMDLHPTSFLFVGTLSKGKQPLYAMQVVEALYRQGKKVHLDVYGEGVLRTDLERYIVENNLESIIALKGNQSKEALVKAYQSHHFLMLPSKSEGWPKVVAEAMVWGCVPVASPVSCVPYMLGNGSRGLILQEDFDLDVNQIMLLLSHQEGYEKMASEGQFWSRQFTTDKLELAIKGLLRG